MIDYRIDTFLTLCKLMNYRQTAEALQMTQPAVTQHIQYLEKLYDCKLFDYTGKKLTQTEKGRALEQYAKSLVYSHHHLRDTLMATDTKHTRRKLALGATKTIGDYVIDDLIMHLLTDPTIALEVIIENTQQLLEKLNDLSLDILMIEGYFDKKLYDYHTIRYEELIGICSYQHPFAGKEVALTDLFSQHLILREVGSGTRSVFDHFLYENNYTLESFSHRSVLSSYTLIEHAIAANIGISFVYQSLANASDTLSAFKIKGHTIRHEFNYVFLKNTTARDLIKYLPLTPSR